MKIFKNNSNNNFEHQKKFPRTKKTDFLYKILLASKANEQGSGLVFAFSVGLLLLILGTATIITSGQNKTNAVVNEKAKQSLAITQAGVNNLMAQLSKQGNSSLLLLNNDPSPAKLGCNTGCNQWNDPNQKLSYTGEVNSCSSSATITSSNVLGVTSAQGVGAGNGAGEFELLAYRFEDGDGNLDTVADNKGTLLVEGNLIQSTDSKSRFEVEIPVEVTKASSGGNSSSLMATNIDIGQTDVVGAIVCTDPANCSLDCQGGTTPTPDQLEDALLAGNNANLTDPSGGPASIQIGGSSIPDIPNVPVGATVTPLNNVTSDQTLPLPGDTPLNNTYYYQVDNWTGGQILIENSNTDEFHIYVSGDITLNGSDGIGMEVIGTGNPPPEEPGAGQIRIFGGYTDGTMPSSQTWGFGGTFCNTAFLHAPNATVNFNGGGAGCKDMTISNGTTFPASNAPNFFGSVWVKDFIANSSNSTYFYEQPDIMTALGATYGADEFYPDVIKMGSATKIERKEAN